MKKNLAIYPGTFDPITKGHMEIINRASKIFGHLIIAVAEASSKSPIFSVEERAEMIKHELKTLKNPGIEVISFSGLLVDFAKKNNANVILRGLRAASDFEYEFQMSYMNHKISPEIETLFIPANEKSHFISSRFVKEMARLGSGVEVFVSENVAEKLYAYYKKHP